MRHIAVTMAVGAALCGTIADGGTALAMPFSNLAATSNDRVVQKVDYLCGPSYGCWTQPNAFYGPFYGPVTGPVAVAPAVPSGYAIRWQGPPPYGRLWYGRSPYDPGWYTGGWRW